MLIISEELEKFFRTWGYNFETTISYRSNRVSYVLTLTRTILPNTRVQTHYFNIVGRDIILTKKFIKFILDNYFESDVARLFPKKVETDMLKVTMYGGKTGTNLYKYYYEYSLR